MKAEEFDKLFERDEDITQLLELDKSVRPNQEREEADIKETSASQPEANKMEK